MPLTTNNTQEIIEGIITKYERLPSILKIKNNFDFSILFDFPKAELADVNSLFKQAGHKKATGPDTVPPQISKNSTNVTDKHLCNIINIDVDNHNVPDNTKFATVRLIYKRKSRNELENYRPISLLNAFTKIYERYILN